MDLIFDFDLELDLDLVGFGFDFGSIGALGAPVALLGGPRRSEEALGLPRTS